MIEDNRSASSAPSRRDSRCEFLTPFILLKNELAESDPEEEQLEVGQNRQNDVDVRGTTPRHSRPFTLDELAEMDSDYEMDDEEEDNYQPPPGVPCIRFWWNEETGNINEFLLL